jgi:hypothetical protein
MFGENGSSLCERLIRFYRASRAPKTFFLAVYPTASIGGAFLLLEPPVRTMGGPKN